MVPAGRIDIDERNDRRMRGKRREDIELPLGLADIPQATKGKYLDGVAAARVAMHGHEHAAEATRAERFREQIWPHRQSHGIAGKRAFRLINRE